MGAFQTGFGMGMQAWDSAEAAKERKLARERQDRMDKVTLDAAGQQAELNTFKLDELKQERTVRDAVRLAGTEMKGVEGYASGAAGQQVFSADKGVAQATTDINNAVAEMESDPIPGAAPGAVPATPVTPANTELRAATGVTGGGQPAIAGPGMKFDNSPEARMKRQAEALTGYGRLDEAQKLETEFATNESKRYDANRNLLFGSFTKALQSGGAAAAIKLYDDYDDGFTAELQENGAGGVVIKKNKAGDEVGRLTYKSPEDLALQVKRVVFPEQYLASAEASAAKAAEDARDPNKRYMQVRPGSVVYDTTTGEKAIDNSMGYVEDVNGDLVKPGRYTQTGGGAGSARTSKPEPTRSEQVTDILMAANEKAGSDGKLSADQLVQARDFGSAIARFNSNLDVNAAAHVARQVALNPELVAPDVGDNGRIMNVFTRPDGTAVPVGDVNVSKLTPEQRAAMKPHADKFVAEIGGGDPAEMDLVRRMAFGDKEAERQLRDGFIVEQARVLREQNPKLNATQVNSIAGQAYAREMQKIAGKLRAIGQLSDPPKDRPEPRQAPAARAPTDRTPTTQASGSFNLSSGVQSPDSREAIAARVAMANRGGSPLSPRERLLVREFGLDGPRPAAAPARAAAATAPDQADAAPVDLSLSPTSMGMPFDTPGAKQALTVRVRQANASGQPLSRVERLRAQQLGILN